MASLQVRHQRGCALGKAWTPAGKLDGCDCAPTYNVVSRVDGKLVREPAGQNRAEAEKRLARIEFAIEENDYTPPEHETFEQFAARWLEGVRARPTTRESYAYTIAYASAAFGRKRVSKLVASDIAKLVAHIEREHPGISETTLAKHVRQVTTVLRAAKLEGALRVVPKLDKTRSPKARKGTAFYFTNDELERLWPELEGRPVYLTLCKVAAYTGMRIGELAGLRWGDVDRETGEVHVVRQFTHGAEAERPKDADPRVVHLVPPARELLELWWVQTYDSDAGLVFENEEGGHLDASRTRKVLYSAMKRAGIPRAGERGGARTFHSFRHSFARVALEKNVPITWVQAELGHSTIGLTVDLYGDWSQAAARETAASLGGAFAV